MYFLGVSKCAVALNVLIFWLGILLIFSFVVLIWFKFCLKEVSKTFLSGVLFLELTEFILEYFPLSNLILFAFIVFELVFNLSFSLFSLLSLFLEFEFIEFIILGSFFFEKGIEFFI